MLRLTLTVAAIWYNQGLDALPNPRTPDSIQNCHPYTGNLSSETPGDSKKAFLHWGHVLELPDNWARGWGLKQTSFLQEAEGRQGSKPLSAATAAATAAAAAAATAALVVSYMSIMCHSFLTWSVRPAGLQQLQQQLLVCLCSSSCQLHPWCHLLGWLWTLHQIFIPLLPFSLYYLFWV